MKTSIQRSSLLSLSLLVGACSAADAAPDFEPATEPAPGAEQDESRSSDVLAQTAPDASAQTQPAAATCANGRGTIRSGRVNIKVGSENRSYIVYVPPGYNGSKPVPLLVDLHPLLMNASIEQGSSGFQAIAAREGFIIAFPEGTQDGPGVYGSGWNIGKCCTKSNDEAFIRALVNQVKGNACIDEKRVYAAGFSMGGGMSHYLACNAAEVFAAVAPSSFDLLVENEMPCKPARPISVVIHRGNKDGIVPFGGGASSPPNGSPGPIHFEGAEGTFKRWAQINGCTGTPTSAPGGGVGTTCRTYSQCKDSVEVTLCVKNNGGHEQGNAPYLWSHISKYSIP